MTDDAPAKLLAPTPLVGLDELTALSRSLARQVSGDIEWSAAQFREFTDAARALCNAVDRFVDQRSGASSPWRCLEHGGYGFGADCVECHPMKSELGTTEQWFYDGHSNGLITVQPDGSVVINPNDDYYMGTLSPAQAARLARAIERSSGGRKER